MMKKNSIILFLILCSGFGFAQKYLLPNEELIFSFETKNGKKMVLAKDKENEYIIYRFGTEKKIELEYPKVKNKKSWEKFTYFYYGKPGGPENDGMYLHSVNFRIGSYRYSVYSNKYLNNESDDDIREGVLIVNEVTEKKKKIIAYESIKGNLDGFVTNNLLKFEDIENYE